jgi:uncharacterized membrane protein
VALRAPARAAPPARSRRAYLDWLRGIAVLLMIEAHLLDSWTADADRASAIYRGAMLVGGMGSVLFLLLAGVAVALSAGSKFRRSGDTGIASAAVARRGLEIFALAFVFRLQAWVLGWSSEPRDLLKVDILNIMGPSIIACALLWRLGGTLHRRAVLFGALTLATALVTPVVRAAGLDSLPDALAGYFVPVQGLSNFMVFPWTGMVFGGTCLGVLIDHAGTAPAESRLNARFVWAGLAVALVSFGASSLPSPYGATDFWTASPSFFFIRLGFVMIAIAAAYWWVRTFAGSGRWSPIVQLGRTSLFIYWIHVEMVYGLISRPLHHGLRLRHAFAAYVLFTVFMLLCSIAKDRAVARFALARQRGSGAERLRESRRTTS